MHFNRKWSKCLPIWQQDHTGDLLFQLSVSSLPSSNRCISYVRPSVSEFKTCRLPRNPTLLVSSQKIRNQQQLNDVPSPLLHFKLSLQPTKTKWCNVKVVSLWILLKQLAKKICANGLFAYHSTATRIAYDQSGRLTVNCQLFSFGWMQSHRPLFNCSLMQIIK